MPPLPTVLALRPLAAALAAALLAPALTGALPKHLTDGCPLCNNKMPAIDGGVDFGVDGGLLPDNFERYESSLRTAPPPNVARSSAAAGTKPALAPAAPTPAASASAAPAPALAEPPSAAKTPAVFPAVKPGPDGYWQVGFEHLASFTFPEPPPGATPKPGSVEHIPAEVRALDGKRVAIGGYMLPVKMERGMVKEFLLLRSSQLCCYGVVPAVNEWVLVKMKGKGTVTMMDVPLKFYGTLRVGALYEGGAFGGLYLLDGDKVAVD